ncbi:MAG: DinB family protein [Bacillota bacterium]
MTMETGTASQRIVRLWANNRNALIALAERLPEFTAGYKPWSDARSTLDLLNHIAWAGELFLACAVGREMKKIPEGTTIAEARKILAETFAEQSAEISKLSEADLAKNGHIALINLTEPAGDMLHRMVIHEAHHKGQLLVYARMQGIEPPFFLAG